MRWRVRQAQPDVSASDALIREAELFVEGRYLELSFTNERDVPNWTWLATLAHGDDVSLRLAEQWMHVFGGLRPEYDVWGRVLQQLACQINELTNTTRCSLEQVQRDVLIPFELALMTTPVGPATLYRVVSSMLGRVREQVESEHR